MEHDYYTEDFDVYLYKNNLWLKGKKNFFGENYSKKYIRFTYAEDFTFNIFETEIREVAINNLPKITFSVELIQQNKIPSILKVNTFIGSEIENELHQNKMVYPEYIINNNKIYTNLTKVEMPTEIYKKKYLENEFDLIMFNCRLYTISKYLKSKIYFGNLRLKYDLWNENDEPEYSLELCPNMNQNLNLDEIHDESDDENDNNDKGLNNEFYSIVTSHLNEIDNKMNNKMNNLEIALRNIDKKMDKLYTITIFYFALFGFMICCIYNLVKN